MSYIAEITRVSDGRVTSVPMEFDWDKGDGLTDEFWWSDGNFACDCNRSMQVGDDDSECGDSRYLVRIVLPDGTVPYDETVRDGSIEDKDER